MEINMECVQQPNSFPHKTFFPKKSWHIKFTLFFLFIFVEDNQENIPNVPLVENIPLTCHKCSNIQMPHLQKHILLEKYLFFIVHMPSRAFSPKVKEKTILFDNRNMYSS